MELFFSDDIIDGRVRLDAEESTHCVRVLRHRAGDEISVIDGRGTLYRCVLDVLSFLRVLDRPEDEISWFRILVLYPGIGERYAHLIMESSGNHRASNGFLVDPQWARRKFGNELRGLHDALAEFSKTEFDELPAKVVRYYVELRRRVIEQGAYDDESHRSEDLEKLDEDANALEALVTMAGAYKSTAEFLDAIVLDALPKTPTQARALAAAGEGQEAPDAKEMVVLSTIHSIKGLEYKAVFVLDCVDGKFPRSRPGDDPSAEMEELRCFYVAVTRAKDWLYICAPLMTRRYDGMPERSQVTRFLDDVDDDLYLSEFPDGKPDEPREGRRGGWDDDDDYWDPPF